MIMIINIAAFCLLVLCLAIRFEEKIAEVIPTGVCLLIFILYGLAFWNRLSWIDGIGAAFCFFGCAGWRWEERRNENFFGRRPGGPWEGFPPLQR